LILAFGTNHDIFFLNLWVTQNFLIIPPWTKNSLFGREGVGAIIRNTKNTFFAVKIPKYFFPKNFFLKYYYFFFPNLFFFTAKGSHFLEIQKNIFF
jgi:hypothetical protein